MKIESSAICVAEIELALVQAGSLGKPPKKFYSITAYYLHSGTAKIRDNTVISGPCEWNFTRLFFEFVCSFLRFPRNCGVDSESSEETRNQAFTFQVKSRNGPRLARAV